MLTRAEIDMAMGRIGLDSISRSDVSTDDLRGLLGAIKTRMRFVRSIQSRTGLYGEEGATEHEQATLVCLDDVIRRLCTVARFAPHDALALTVEAYKPWIQ
jgi:hypothetical protein